jgi:hypothetical protein
MEHLDLRETALTGFSMGSGEVVRYLGTYGSARPPGARRKSSPPRCSVQFCGIVVAGRRALHLHDRGDDPRRTGER